MHGKHILLGVTGGIAAYKSADLVRAARRPSWVVGSSAASLALSTPDAWYRK